MTIYLQSFSDELAALIQRISLQIVRVEGRSRLPASGIIYAADGVIVTAHHVVERNDNLRIGLPNGEVVDAAFVGRDPGVDLAVLRVHQSGLDAATWVSAEDLRVGNIVLAMGRPGKNVQATAGIVSAIGGAWRTGAGSEIDHYVQTDVVMYPGFSGGALTTMDGRIAGVNSSALMRGASVTIPAATVKQAVEALLTHGRIPRGYLGVSLQPVQLEANLQEILGQQTGLMLMSIEVDSPAAQAGLLQGDVLVTLDNNPVRQVGELQVLLSSDRAGKIVPIRIVRAGVVQEKQVAIGQK